MPRRRRNPKRPAVERWLDQHLNLDLDAPLNIEMRELVRGPISRRSPFGVFGSEEVRRAGWGRAREVLMADAEPGDRPWAWWHYEAPDAGDLETDAECLAYLLERGELDAEECRERLACEARWAAEAEDDAEAAEREACRKLLRKALREMGGRDAA